MKKLGWIIVLIVGYGCVATTPPGDQTHSRQYPQAYRHAIESQQGVADVQSQYVDRFVALFNGLGDDHPAIGVEDVYAADLYFSDSLMHTSKRSDVVAHFDRMRSADTSVSLLVHDRVIKGQDVYVIWSMTARFTPLGRESRSDTLGITHLRFDADGRIVLHQDFWDTGLGFYAHVPIIGYGVRAVGNRFSAEPDFASDFETDLATDFEP